MDRAVRAGHADGSTTAFAYCTGIDRGTIQALRAHAYGEERPSQHPFEPVSDWLEDGEHENGSRMTEIPPSPSDIEAQMAAYGAGFTEGKRAAQEMLAATTATPVRSFVPENYRDPASAVAIEVEGYFYVLDLARDEAMSMAAHDIPLEEWIADPGAWCATG